MAETKSRTTEIKESPKSSTSEIAQGMLKELAISACALDMIHGRYDDAHLKAIRHRFSQEDISKSALAASKILRDLDSPMSANDVEAEAERMTDKLLEDGLLRGR
ncbi:MAG: hypothetical protein ACREBH_03890 [Candidatus Micrarchaeaceae archaeon]